VSGEFDKAYWEDRYDDPGTHRHPPSPQLVAEVAGLPAGVALEAGCGEGANAVWLARRGWRVTAVDISANALRRARRHAELEADAAASRIEWVEADLTAEPPVAGAFDLVSAHYVHPAGPFADLFQALVGAVAPGGTLLVVGHDPADAHSAAHGPAGAALTAEELAAGLDPAGWDVEVAETRVRDGGSHSIPLHDAVLRATRRV
jgi:SAM-dependent methyltransferase